MAAMLCDIVVVVVGRTRPRYMPLAILTMRKELHGFVIGQQEPRFFTDFIAQGNMAYSHEERQPDLQRIMGTSCHVTS